MTWRILVDWNNELFSVTVRGTETDLSRAKTFLKGHYRGARLWLIG